MATLAKERSSRALFFYRRKSDDGKAYSPVDYRNHCGLWEKTRAISLWAFLACRSVTPIKTEGGIKQIQSLSDAFGPSRPCSGRCFLLTALLLFHYGLSPGAQRS